MTPAAQSIRLQLSEYEAGALHSALVEAIAANLLSPAEVDAAHNVLERLGARVPSWLERSVVRGEAGYLIAADAVLKILVAAEERGRTTLSQTELAHELGDRKPVGVTIDDVLTRMRREKLIRVVGARGEAVSCLTAAPAGRRQLNGKAGPASSDEWRVSDATALLELIFREYRPGREAHRPSVQAIGRLSDERFDGLASELRADELLEQQGDNVDRLVLTDRGERLAEERARASLPARTFLWELPAPPLPYVRGLPLRADRHDRECSCRNGHAAWLQPSSRTKLHATIRRVGAAEWECRWCGRRWLIFLLPHTRDGRPAYEEPDRGTHVRPIWRPR